MCRSSRCAKSLIHAARGHAKTHHRHEIGDALYQRTVVSHGLAHLPYGISVNVELHLRCVYGIKDSQVVRVCEIPRR